VVVFWIFCLKCVAIARWSDKQAEFKIYFIHFYNDIIVETIGMYRQEIQTRLDSSRRVIPRLKVGDIEVMMG